MLENYVDKHYLSRNKIKILFVYFLLIVLTSKNIYERREFSKIHIAPYSTMPLMKSTRHCIHSEDFQ